MSKRRRGTVALACAALLAALAVPQAASASDAGSITKSSGAVAATLAWQGPTGKYGYGVTHPHLTITRAGAVAFDMEITDVCGVGCELVEDTPEFADYSILKVADLDGDGEPEVLVDTFTGGAHCCTITRFYSYRPATGTYTRDPSYNWLDTGYKLVDLDGDGKPELSGFDPSFAYAFSSYAGSQFPPLVFSFRRDVTTGKGSPTDVTRHFPELIKPHAARMLRAIRKAKKDGTYEIQGTIAAYAADEYLLGKGSVARAELSRDRAKGVTRKGFTTDLLKFLKHLGYR